MLPIIHSVLTHPSKKIKVSLLFAAQSPEELYFKDELDQLAKSFGGQFIVSYAVDKFPAGTTGTVAGSTAADEITSWSGHVGYVNQDMLKGLLPAPLHNPEESAKDSSSKKTIVLVCGPESMVKHVAGPRGMSGQEPVRGVLGAMGYSRSQVFRFPN